MGKVGKDDKDVEVLNPRYAGATPGMVVRALARPVKDAGRESDEGRLDVLEWDRRGSKSPNRSSE